MRVGVPLIVVGMWMSSVTYGVTQAAPQAPAASSGVLSPQGALLKQYCATCHTVSVAFLEKPQVEDTKRLAPFVRSSFGPQDHTGSPHIETVTIAGPFNPTGSGDTPSRRRLFVCRPSNGAAEDVCARQVIATVARRAYKGGADSLLSLTSLQVVDSMCAN